MTTLEKLFIQIFERKDGIIEQIQRQADAYSEQLASRLLIDGITPPPCLLNPRFNSRSPHPHELKKEEIISKLLLPPPRNSVAYSSGAPSLYYRPVVNGGNGHLPNEMSMETHAPNKGLNVTNEPPVPLACPNVDICTLNRVCEVDDSVNSPQNETDARISSIYAAPDASLARIQRSKSRQKAREIRNSAKTVSKSCLGDENRTHISFTGDTISKSDTHQVSEDNFPSKLDKSNDNNGANSLAEEGKGRTRFSGRLSRSNTCDEKHNFENDHPKTSDKSLQQSGHVDGVMEGVNLPEISLGSYGDKKSVNEITNDTQRQSKLYSGRITRSKGSSQQISGLNKSLKSGTSVSFNSKEGKGALSHSVGDLIHGIKSSNKLSDAVETCQANSERNVETEAICSNKDVKKPVISSNIAVPRVTRSKSGAVKECPVGANNKEDGETVVGNGPTDVPGVTQPVNSRRTDVPAVAVCTESDGLGLKKSSECCMLVKPKQLNFDEIDGCDSSKISSLVSKKRKLDGLLEQEHNPLTDSASLKDDKNSAMLFDQQLSVTDVLSDKSKSARRHSDEDLDVCTKIETMSVGLEMNEKPMADGLLGQECNSSSSKDHNTSGTLIEQQLQMENVVSSQLKAAIAHSDDDVDECAKDEMVNIGLEMNENTVVDDVEHNSEVSPHDDAAVICEVDLHNKGEEIAADDFIPESKDPKLSFTSSLTKQGDKDFEDCLDKELQTSHQDFVSSKSKESELGTNSKLSNLNLNSAKVNTWPRDPQKKVQDQRNCLSDSRGVRVHIQGDAIHCDLDTSENDLHVTQSDVIQTSKKRAYDEMVSDLPQETESLHHLQAAQPTVTEVDDDTLQQSAPSLIKSPADDCTYDVAADDCAYDVAADDSTYDVAADDSTYDVAADVAAADQTMDDDGGSNIKPVYEGFTINEELENAEVGGTDFDILKISSTTIERASLLEQICKSASTNTPFSQFPSTFTQHQVQDLYRSMPDGHLDDMDLEKRLSASDIDITEPDYSFPNQQTFDSVTYSGTPFNWQSKNYYSSPVGKLWDRSASSSGSSENRLSSNPELTCFPIEEDPNSNEESENDELQENELKIPVTVSTEMENVTPELDDDVAVEIEEGVVVPKLANHEPPTGPMKYRDRCSSNSVNIEVNVPKTHDKVKYKSKFHAGIRSSKYEDENRTPSVATRASVRRTASIQTQNSVRRNVSLQTQNGRIQRPPQKEGKRNNIVSNITSFVSIVQQKKEAAVLPVKRDINVKALGAAEAAKRREQEKEKERKMKKEEIAKARELNKKKKQQEELQKKEADVAERKRKKEEDERKQMAKKRKIADPRKEQKVQHEKAHGGKHVISGNKKGPENVSENLKENKNANAVQQVISVPENGDKEKETNIHEKSPGQVGSMTLTSQESSYDISPYQCSDDEDEYEDDLPTKKFVPSWASKKAVAMVLPLQQDLDPETIFSLDKCCSMNEVLLPRRLQGL